MTMTTATVEKLFVQIFERKNWIIQQVKQQTDLYNQHLASKLLVDGITPPPWLWNDNQSPNDPNELNKEDLISEILLPHPRPVIRFPGACCSLYNKPVGEGGKGERVDGIFRETYSQNECFEDGNKEEVAGGCFNNNTRCSMEVPELDVSVTSPQDETEVRISSIFHGPDQSVVRIQRSKSRQKALEIRNSAKTESRCRLNLQNDPVGSSLTNGLSIFSNVEDRVMDLKELGEPGFTNSENCGVGEMLDGSNENVNEEKGIISCISTITGSRSSAKRPSSAKDFVKGDSSAATSQKNDCTVVKDGKDLPQCSKVLNASREVFNPDVTAESGGFFEASLMEDCLSPKEKDSDTSDDRILRPSIFLDGAPARDISNDFVMIDGGIPVRFNGKSAQQFEDANDFLELTEHSVGLVHDRVRSQKMSGDEGMPKLLGTSILADQTDTKSISGAIEKPQAGRHEVRNSSDGQVVLPCLDSHDAANQQGKFETVASDVTVNDQPANSRSILHGTGPDCLITRSSSDYLAFMDPKQLVFDEREECNLRDKYSLTVENECLKSSPDKVFDTSLHPPLSLDHEASSGNMILQKLSSVERGVSTKEDEACRISLCTNTQEHVDVQIKKGSDIYEYSTQKNVVVDAEAVLYVPNSKFTSPADIIPPNVTECPDTENPTNLCCKELSEGELHSKVDFKCNESKCASSISKSKPFVASNISCSAKKAIGVPPDCSNEEVGTPCHTNILVGAKGQYRVESSSLGDNVLTCGSVGSADHEILDLSKSRELQISKKLMVDNLRSLGVDSWPRSKRRKIQEEESDCFSASPSFRVNKHYPSQMESTRVKQVGHDIETVLGYSSSVNESAQMEIYPNMACQLTEEMESSPKLQTEEFALSSEDLGDSAEAISSSESNQVRETIISILSNGPGRFSNGCLVEEMKLASAGIDATNDNHQKDDKHWLHLEGEGNLANGEGLMMERRHQRGKSYLGCEGQLSGGLGWPPPKRDLDLTCADQMMPELEGFIIDPQIERDEVNVPGGGINFEKLELPRTSIECASILEQICKSTITQTPLNQFSSAFKLHESNKFCHSVPNGLLECMDLMSISAFNEDVQKQLSASYMDNANGFPLKVMSYSDSLPCLGARFGWESRNPYTSPVGKLWERTSLHTGSSEKRLSSNPELTCFPIEEDPSFSEENENASELTEKIQEDNNYLVDTCARRESLGDITETNTRTSISAEKKSVYQADLDSINTEVSFKGTSKKMKQKTKSYCRYKSEGKENDVPKIALNAIKKPKESTNNKFRKASSLRKTSLKREIQKLSEKEPKRNNIVSNVTSFIPLVQQKQAAAVCTGKRDVKVKALEIAEATKRLEEKKENERKMRKEALKLERARVEQENLRQMELTKKKKEEERKKRDDDTVAKKRQREEEERKDKERKRKRIEERRMKREEGTLCSQKIEKEKQLCDIDERDLKNKESDNLLQKSQNVVKEIRDGVTSEKPETEQTPDELTFQADISVARCAASCDSSEYVKANAALDRSGKTDTVIVQKSQEKSYDISPYQCSDDEDEEEDEENVPNRKFIPSWASKNCVALVLPLQQGVEPDVIFPPESFCRIDEVCPSPKAKRVMKMKGQR